MLRGMPTREALVRRQVPLDHASQVCPFCQGAVESIDHVFLSCHLA